MFDVLFRICNTSLKNRPELVLFIFPRALGLGGLSLRFAKSLFLMFQLGHNRVFQARLNSPSTRRFVLRGAPALVYFMYDTGEYVSDKMEPSKKTFPQVFRIAQGQELSFLYIGIV
ncbi:predicted protein [Histoplasma mississippiense (nom. inval.)]|uniref:predicted protein n=1 Tax=Ajellomyces capsulatus (strain NAm1 / WU24) TaxID=2059318 RepID=UPI000157BB59|nr:predicted protein [Histoplasma mississippiense (nom. inval.)]EDN04190.1 predicted protein [Histoplasma mississippiense (nom. inval.)]